MSGTPPPLTTRETLRWAWRQLTSMRVALILLLLLAVAAVPGSLIPQRDVDPTKVLEFARENPRLADIYDRLGLFDVYSTPWFAAIYLMLFVSLVGCIVPRTRQHWASMRARPPAAPRNLRRLPAWRSFETDAPAADTLSAAHEVLRRERYRVERSANPSDHAVSAEKGYLRETGNLIFHTAFVGILVAVAVGSLFGFRGSVLVVEGETFSNTLTRYDDFEPGGRFDAADLAPFTFMLREFSARYDEEGAEIGTPRDFDARVEYRASPEAPTRDENVQVNHPLAADGAEVFLISHGYAPVFTVRDRDDNLAFQGPVPFLPQDGNLTSTGVVKVPDAVPEQLAFQGRFLPTAAPVEDERLGPISVFPAARNPWVYLTAWHGDLGLDSGVPQSVYQLDDSKMTQFTENGEPFRVKLAVGDTTTLPDGMGSLTFDGYREWATFQVSRDPGSVLALGSAIVALAGLLLSLGIRRRRMWVRVSVTAGGRSVVEVGGLARTEAPGLDEEVEAVAERLRAAARAAADEERAEETDEENRRWRSTKAWRS